jgi:hypothetical protein
MSFNGRRAPPRGGGCCARIAFRLIFCQDPGSRSTSRSSESRMSPARARLPSTLGSDDDDRGQCRTPSPPSEDASINSGDWQDLLDSSPVRPSGRAGSSSRSGCQCISASWCRFRWVGPGCLHRPSSHVSVDEVVGARDAANMPRRGAGYGPNDMLNESSECSSGEIGAKLSSRSD